MRRAMVDFGADSSYEKAAQKVAEHYGVEVSAGRVKAECMRIAKELPQKPQVARMLAAKGPEVIIAQADGTMIPMVQISEQAEGDRRKHRQVCWKEMRLVAAQAQGSTRTWYGAGMDTPEEAGARWTQVVRQAGCAQATRVHGLGDGAEWISGQFGQHFGTRGSCLLDLYHVCEYMEGCAPEGMDKAQYLENTREALKQNRSDEVIKELAGRKERPEEPEENAPVRKAHRYLDKRRGQLDYKGALEAELPVGSGIIEGGNRNVLQARLKISGAWWREDNAHAMAQLRAVRANGLWPLLWPN